MNRSTPPVLAVIGPSGSGKSTLVRRLAERGLVRLHPTYTTRPTRRDEQRPGAAPEHVFCSEVEFDRLERSGHFFRVARPFELPFRYGLPRFSPSPAGPVDCVMLRAPFVEDFKALVPAVVVYQIEVDAERARRRMMMRGDAAPVTEARLHRFGSELVAGRRLADRTFVNDGPLDDLVNAVAQDLAA